VFRTPERGSFHLLVDADATGPISKPTMNPPKKYPDAGQDAPRTRATIPAMTSTTAMIHGRWSRSITQSADQ